MRLHEKPAKPVLGGTYKITLDGYLICAIRRNTALPNLALRPLLEYGRLVYRTRIGGKAMTLRAYLLVREAWGKGMVEDIDFKARLKAIDAHNKWIRAEHTAKRKRDKEADKPPVRELCPYCKKRPMRNSAIAKTCGHVDCVEANRKTRDREWQRAKLAKSKSPTPHLWDKPLPGPWQHPMPCPWVGGLFESDTLPFGVTSWSDPRMDPMSAGFPMNYFNAPSVAQECAA